MPDKQDEAENLREMILSLRGVRGRANITPRLLNYAAIGEMPYALNSIATSRRR